MHALHSPQPQGASSRANSDSSYGLIGERSINKDAAMVTRVILSMDVSCGETKIREVLLDMDGVQEVEVFPSTDRVVVTGDVKAVDVQALLGCMFEVHVYLVSDHSPNLDLSDDDDDSEDDDDDSEDDEDSEDEDDADDHGTSTAMSSLTLGTGGETWNQYSAGGWYGVPTPEPAWGDQPVPDPSHYFQQQYGSAAPVRQPAWEDQPVADPSSYFFQYGSTPPVVQPAWEDQSVADPSPYFFQQYSNTPPVPPENESQYLPLNEAGDRGDNKDCSIM